MSFSPLIFSLLLYRFLMRSKNISGVYAGIFVCPYITTAFNLLGYSLIIKHIKQ